MRPSGGTDASPGSPMKDTCERMREIRNVRSALRSRSQNRQSPRLHGTLRQLPGSRVFETHHSAFANGLRQGGCSSEAGEPKTNRGSGDIITGRSSGFCVDRIGEKLAAIPRACRQRHKSTVGARHFNSGRK